MRSPSSATILLLEFRLLSIAVVSFSPGSGRAIPAGGTAQVDDNIQSDAAKPPCQFRQGSTCGCQGFYKPLRVKKAVSDEHLQVDLPYHTEADAEKGFETFDYYEIDDMVFRKNPHLGQADQVVPPNQTDQLFLKYWPGGIIFYLIDPQFRKSYRDDILSAINEIETNVGKKHLEFKEALTAKGRVCRKNYMFLKKIPEKMCRAEVGMQTESPYTHVWLNQDSCHGGIVQHEILHALGRYHEQSRPDRDKFVTLVPGEISDGECPNYYIASDLDKLSSRTPYDIASIMHYGSCHFSCRGRYTMTRKNGDPISANRVSLTKIDVEKMRLLYPADAKVLYKAGMCIDPPETAAAAARLRVSLPVLLVFTALSLTHFN